MTGLAVARGLARIRRRRWFLWGVLIVYVPVIWLSLVITKSDSATAVVFAVWFACLLVAACAMSFASCPRCGNYYHAKGSVPLPVRRCVHCGLGLNEDKADRAAERPGEGGP